MTKRRHGNIVETNLTLLSPSEIKDREYVLQKRGIRQKLSQKAQCANCRKSPVLMCNTWHGDFVTGHECRTPVCEECAVFRGGIVYCYTCSERYR